MRDIEYYRGQSMDYTKVNKNNKNISPTIFRNTDDLSTISESNFYIKTIELMKDVLNVRNNDELIYYAITLGKLQHYGVPTRLIDLTTNYNVALYFACCGNYDDDGYVYRFTEKDGFKPILGDWRLHVTRKIDAIFNSNDLISKEIDLKSYFINKEKDNKSTIHRSTITDPVILDYDKVFGNIDANNLRYNRQEGSFVLLGNEVEEKDNKVYLKEQVRTDLFDNLQSDIISSYQKLEHLFMLSNDHKINYVYLFPDNDESMDLIIKYNKIFNLNKYPLNKIKALKKVIEDKFKQYNGKDNDVKKRFSGFVDEIISRSNDLINEFSRNENLFYFVFYELVNYYNYYIKKELHKEEVIKKINIAFKYIDYISKGLAV